MARLNQETSGVIGLRLFMQPVQDINIGGRLTATQYQYTLTDVDITELNRVGANRSERTIEAAARSAI